MIFIQTLCPDCGTITSAEYNPPTDAVGDVIDVRCEGCGCHHAFTILEGDETAFNREETERYYLDLESTGGG